MKKTTSTVVALLCFAAVTIAQDGIPSAQPGVRYGREITKDGAISIHQLEAKLSADSIYVGKVEGKVVEVCKKKGCFIRVLREGKGDPVLVQFKDYGFFMPPDIVGKTIVLEGEARIREISIAQQQHFAVDAGKDAGEIAHITEPKIDINIIANGVVVVH